MKLKRSAKRRQPETIIALIDVVFFLLVFFMLIGRLEATAPFDLRPATAITGADMPAGGTILAISAAGDLALEGAPLEAGALLETLRARLEADPGLTVRVNAHRDASLGVLLPLVGRIEALGAREVVLVVSPPDAGAEVSR